MGTIGPAICATRSPGSAARGSNLTRRGFSCKLCLQISFATYENLNIFEEAPLMQTPLYRTCNADTVIQSTVEPGDLNKWNSFWFASNNSGRNPLMRSEICQCNCLGSRCNQIKKKLKFWKLWKMRFRNVRAPFFLAGWWNKLIELIIQNWYSDYWGNPNQRQELIKRIKNSEF